MNPDGIGGKKNWPSPAPLAGVTIADIVDVGDPALLTANAADIRADGRSPIILPGMSNGVGQAVSDLRSTRPIKEDSTMPRRPRSTLPGVPLPLIQRGNNRQACFFADDDYRAYLTWLEEYASKTHCLIHAYVIMTIHVHLLAQMVHRSS